MNKTIDIPVCLRRVQEFYSQIYTKKQRCKWKLEVQYSVSKEEVSLAYKIQNPKKKENINSKNYATPDHQEYKITRPIVH